MRFKRPSRARIVGLCATLLLGLTWTDAAIVEAAPSAAPPATAPVAENLDYIAFHGGGPLLGQASPVHAPPMKVRWKLRVEDDQPPAPPVAPGKPASQPAYRTPGHFESAAAIANGVVYAADTAGVLRAIDIATGAVKWRFVAEDGFETTPLVLDGRVLLGDLGGIFYAVDAQTGKKLWTVDSDSAIHSSANYFGPSRSQVIFGNDGADIYCLDAATGKQVWTQKAGDRVNGAPSISGGAALVSGCDGELRALAEKNGAELYTVDLGALCPGSTAAAGDRLVLGTDQGRVVCISASAHKELWVFDAIGDHAMVYASPAVADGIVTFGARDRMVYGLDLASGKRIWSLPTRGDVDSSPVISDGRVYVGSKDKKLHVIDLKTGAELWSFTAGRGITASPAVGEGVVVFGDSGGTLFCLE